MAPPSNRRSGHSRRAQYTTFIGYIVAVVGALLGIVLLIVSVNNSQAFAGPRAAAVDATAPAAQLSAKSRTGTRGFVETLAGWFMTGSRNAQLEREVTEARVRLAEGEAIAEENRRLKALLGLFEEEPKPVAAARLIGSTSSSTRRFATLGAGSISGVAVGMGVRSPLGLVGRVLEAGGSTARVLLITDTESVVPVRRASDGIPAFAMGRSDGSIQLRLINLGINPLKRGDAFVTSGAGGLYRPNIGFAVITQVTSDGAIARPLSDPAATELVVVDSIWTGLPAAAPSPETRP